jgi:predicted nucleic acid-binding protein
MVTVIVIVEKTLMMMKQNLMLLPKLVIVEKTLMMMKKTLMMMKQNLMLLLKLKKMLNVLNLTDMAHRR